MTRSSASVVLATLLAAATASATESKRDYRVGVGDMLQVTLADGATRSSRVQTTGTVRLPNVGDVLVAGRSVAEIERQLRVAVEVVDYQSRAVMVVGAVD